jgi:hypothetical protein
VALSVAGWRFLRAVRGSRSTADAPPSARPTILVVLVLLVTNAIMGWVDLTILPEEAMARWQVGRVARLISSLLLLTYLPFLPPRAGGVTRSDPPAWRTARFALLGACLLFAGIDVIRASPEPGIDVWTIQQRGAEVLLAGQNPYVAATVPDTDPETDFTVPYVYPPLAVLVGALGRAGGGDVRFAHLGMLLVSGWALRRIARGRARTTPGGENEALPSLLEDAPALFLWQWPPVFMILDRAWIDPLQVMLVTLVVAAWLAGRRTAAAIALGLLASSKQSMFWILPLALLLFPPRAEWRRWVLAGVAAIAPLVPFVVWDLPRMRFALFDFMSALPPRTDGLCFTSFVRRAFGLGFPTQLGFVFAALVVAATLVRAPAEGGPASPARAGHFALGALVAYFVFFFFNRWAFANYYFLLAGFAALTAATAIRARTPDT